MSLFFIFLGYWLTFSIIENYNAFKSNKTPMKIAKEMGIGYNLGNTYNCCSTLTGDGIENEEIQLWGTILPSKKIIGKLKKFGFKTIRFQVKYVNEISNSEKKYLEWISKIKETVGWIVDKNLYCILSVYYEKEFWKNENITALDKYINTWELISKEFITYDEHLIFETNNEIDINKLSLLETTQSFVDTVRNTKGLNEERLLIIPEFITELELNPFFKSNLPNDSSNKIAISIHYVFPLLLLDDYKENFSLNWVSYYNRSYPTYSPDDWGIVFDYKELIYQLIIIEELYLNKGIPVIIGEAGIMSNYTNQYIYFREFIYGYFSMSHDFEGIVPCLWDTPLENGEFLNYYNREDDHWNDEVIKNMLLKIMKGKNVKFRDHYYSTNEQSVVSAVEALYINIGNNNKILKVKINTKIYTRNYLDYNLSIGFYNSDYEWIVVNFEKEDSKKNYDGTTDFIMDVTDLDLNDYVFALTTDEEIAFINNMTLIYEQKFDYFDYKAYQNAIKEDIKNYLNTD